MKTINEMRDEIEKRILSSRHNSIFITDDLQLLWDENFEDWCMVEYNTESEVIDESFQALGDHLLSIDDDIIKTYYEEQV